MGRRGYEGRLQSRHHCTCRRFQLAVFLAAGNLCFQLTRVLMSHVARSATCGLLMILMVTKDDWWDMLLRKEHEVNQAKSRSYVRAPSFRKKQLCWSQPEKKGQQAMLGSGRQEC